MFNKYLRAILVISLILNLFTLWFWLCKYKSLSMYVKEMVMCHSDHYKADYFSLKSLISSGNTENVLLGWEISSRHEVQYMLFVKEFGTPFDNPIFIRILTNLSENLKLMRDPYFEEIHNDRWGKELYNPNKSVEESIQFLNNKAKTFSQFTPMEPVN